MLRKTLLFVVLLMASVAHAQDITLTNNYGLNQMKPSPGTYSNKSVDGSAAQWTVANSKNPNPSFSNTCDAGNDPTNFYPVSLSGHNNFTFSGGVVNSLVPQDSERVPTYCNSAAVAVFDSDNATIDGVRIVGAWDGVRFAKGSDNFTLQNAWISNVRDDCVENDQLRTGTIKDTLFDGCMVGFSVAPGSSDNQPNQQFNHTVTLDGVLMRMKRYQSRKRAGDAPRFSHGNVFKGTDRSPSFIVKNTVFAYEVDSHQSDSRVTNILNRTIECSNNELLWLGSGPLPSLWPQFPDSCYTKLTGQAAQDRWDEVRKDWIDCHPDVVRAPSDDASDPTACSRVVPAPPTNVSIQIN